MKKALISLILILTLGVFSCGGTETGTETLRGAGLGPLVNSDGNVCIGTDCPPTNICPQDNEQLLGLENTAVRNATVSGDPKDYLNGMTVYMGNNHHPSPADPGEPFAEIAMEITRPDSGITVVDQSIQIHR